MAAPRLLPSQAAAIAHVTQYARGRADRARTVLDEVCRMSNIAPASLERAIANIREHARIALHFHPDRPDAQLRTVAENLLAQGVYRSQFETRLSNGGLTAFPGGARDTWEHGLFGGAYQGSLPSERPKYGALDLLRHADGPSPRFGSCYFLLCLHVTRRATFTYLDSNAQPLERGTWDEWSDVVAALFENSFTSESVLGERDLRPPELLARLLGELPQPLAEPRSKPMRRNLNHYIEAQVHGDVRLNEDVDALVIDPCFDGSDTGHVLDALCQQYGIPKYVHAGSSLGVVAVPSDFRGPTMPSLAARVAAGGELDAAAIGRAVNDLARNPGAWADRGSPAEVLQELKLLWHVLVRCGAPPAGP